MEIPQKAKRLRIYVGESDRADGKPLYEAIVIAAKKAELGGATVFRSPMGFGKTSRLHTEKILQLSSDLPIIIEIVDEEAKLTAFLDIIKPLMKGGLLTMEDVSVLHYHGIEK
ncbi:MAG: DUF190 domain-containing protein [Chthoniobacterales bacterium]